MPPSTTIACCTTDPARGRRSTSWGEDFAGTCVESKYVDDRWGHAFKTVAASGQSPGFVVTRSGLQEHDDGWAIPAGAFVYLIGS